MIVALLCFASPVLAEDLAPFYGVWGTPQQCAGLPIKEGGTYLAAPFEIDDAFLKHGDVWCRLTWGPVAQRNGQMSTGAQALCGEDSVQGYQLGLHLAGDTLTLRWGLFQSNTRLNRCVR